MNAKISILAGAIVLAIAGNASASIQPGSTGNGELLLSLFDTTTNTSYTRGLGVDMNAFLSGASVNFGTAATSFSGGIDTNSYSLAADASLANFLAGANKATTVWSVVAADTTGTGYNGKKELFTSTDFAVSGTNAVTQANSTANSATNYDGTYVNSVNNMMPSGSLPATYNNKESIATTQANGGTGYAGGTNFASNLGSFLQGTDTAGLGQSQNFFVMTASNGLAASKAKAYEFADATGASTFTLSSAGNLSYSIASPVAAVPEPGEWAMLASGLAMLGFIGSRRSKKA